MSSAQYEALAELGRLVEPLGEFGSPEGVVRLLRDLGWNFSGTLTTGVQGLDQNISALRTAINGLSTATTDEQRRNRGQEALQQATALTGRLVTIHDDLSQLFTTNTDFRDNAGLSEDLFRRLIDYLVVRYLAIYQPPALRVCQLVGLIEFRFHAAEATRFRRATGISRVMWERIPQLFSNPGAVAHDAYRWGETDFKADLFFARVCLLFAEFGFPAGPARQNPLLRTALGRDPADEHDWIAPLYRGEPAQNTFAEAGLRFSPVPGAGGDPPGFGVFPYATGGAAVSVPLGELELFVKANAALTPGLALIVRPPHEVSISLDLLAGGGSPMSFGLGAGIRRLPADTDLVLFGAPGETRLTINAFALQFVAQLDLQHPSVGVEVDTTKLVVAVVPGQGDGFLQKVLPAEGISAELDLGFGLATDRGFYFTKAPSIEIAVPVHISIGGVITIDTVYARLTLGTETVVTAVSVDAGVKLGPISGSVSRVGIKLTFTSTPTGEGNLGTMNLGLAFKPPEGAGLSIKAGPVTGGGYVFFDEADEQYAGILQLGFQAIGLTAIGLLTTRLPDPSGPPGATKKGFSLLIIITIDLPPIQLGYGFTLNGVGGLLGVNRTMVVDALRNGVRDGSVNSILFPQDPIARASQIISQLRAIFPPAEGRFIFGPMVKIGWGPNAIIELSAAVVLELMTPIRIVILGRVQIALPDKKDPVLNLRLDIVGIIDLDRGEVSIDASLVDSKLVVFSLTGDMAIRVGWGATKIFLIAAGGFHPNFQPPAGFPVLRRLAIALAISDNPRLRLESYFALTSNTLQFGALLDIYAKVDTFVGTFSVAALVGFDALIQFQPFELEAHLYASVDILRNNVPLLHAALEATLTGPTPWHAFGYAEFDCLGKHRIDVEATIGEPVNQPAPTISADDVLAEIAAAFARADAWAALPPGESERVVSLRDGETSDDVLVHPLGSLSARQRVLPLGPVVDRFGTAVVPTPVAFSLKGFQVAGGVTVTQSEDLYDDFAPGQFKSLTDDERVGRPAFESMRSGGRMPVAAFRLPDDRPEGVAQASGYQQSVVDVDPPSGIRSASAIRTRRPPRFSNAVLGRLAHAGSAAQVETKTAGAAQFAGRDLGLRLTPPRYVVASLDTLEMTAGAVRESCAEAHDRLDRTSDDASQVVLAHEAA